MRFDYDGAKEVLEMIEKVNLQPDIVTYGVLALGCQDECEARALIQEMNEKGIKMNVQILGAMLKSGCVQKNFDYIIEILNIIKELRLKPSPKMLEVLEIFLKSCNKQRKRGLEHATKDFRNEFNTFKQKLEKWKHEVGIKDLELEEAKKVLKDAPWEQFQSVQADGFEDAKGLKQQKLKKLKRYIGKIKDLAVE
jgi:pentatricopeptide repeat domain-containing protein 1